MLTWYRARSSACDVTEEPRGPTAMLLEATDKAATPVPVPVAVLVTPPAVCIPPVEPTYAKATMEATIAGHTVPGRGAGAWCRGIQVQESLL